MFEFSSLKKCEKQHQPVETIEYQILFFQCLLFDYIIVQLTQKQKQF